MRADVRRELAAIPDPDLRAFYAARAFRPLWIRGRAVDPAAGGLLQAVRNAAGDDLDPAAYRPGRLAAAIGAARSRAPAALAAAEIELSRTLAAYGSDLHRARPGAAVVYSDPAFQPRDATPQAVLEDAARARSMGGFLQRLERMNPLYEGLKQDLRTAPPDERPLIRANLERARALPPVLGRRFVWVDVVRQRLWAYDEGRPVGSMPVIVGKPSEPTPSMAALIRFAVYHPYWNVPPDLVRNSIAPKVLADGPGYLSTHHFQALSDWSANARVLEPEEVDWAAVAAGRQVLRMRQTPGPDNMMGQVKFMFPNALGVYLHDTPLKALFVHGQRTFSAGCVRLSDAAWLARWLLGDRAHAPGPGPEQQAPLPAPVPVYIVYLTAVPGADGARARPDMYGRDPPLEAALRAFAPGPDRTGNPL